MLTVRCRTCGMEHEVEFVSPAEFPWCDHECREIFVDAVQGLANGYSVEELGIDPDSRLAQEAAKEAWAYHRSEVISARDVKEAQYLRNRPGRRDWVRRRYFPV
jgi:endogenous inhibitor of DNA gyrase (YacG/DUF329 family)